MPFDWDPTKRANNLVKHDVDFASVDLFEFEAGLFRASLGANEPRIEAFAPIAGRLHVLVYSIETRALRVISLRRANKREVRLWRDAT